jgi:hypothetical protein
MSEEFYNYEDDDDFKSAEQYLEDQGLLGDMLSITCAQVPDDFMTVRRIGDAEHSVEGAEPVISIITFVAEVHAVDNHISGGVMLTAEGARVVAAHLLNAADEIDGFHAMFNITNNGEAK